VHLAGAAVLCLVAGAGWMFVLAPLAEQASSLARHEAELREAIRAAPKTRADNERMLAQLAEAQAKLAALVARVPETAREAEFLEQLTEAARAAGVEIRDFRPGAVRDRQRCRELEVHLVAEGDFQSIGRWLHAIGNLPRLTRTHHLTVTGPPSNSNRGAVSLTLAVLFGAKTGPQKKEASRG